MGIPKGVTVSASTVSLSCIQTFYKHNFQDG